MAPTKKPELYKLCMTHANDTARYRAMYKTTTADFWRLEYRLMVNNYITSRHIIKTMTYNLPVEVYFLIASYLDDFEN